VFAVSTECCTACSILLHFTSFTSSLFVSHAKYNLKIVSENHWVYFTYSKLRPILWKTLWLEWEPRIYFFTKMSLLTCNLYWNLSNTSGILIFGTQRKYSLCVKFYRQLSIPNLVFIIPRPFLKLWNCTQTITFSYQNCLSAPLIKEADISPVWPPSILDP
jgi:hypothetical protein